MEACEAANDGRRRRRRRRGRHDSGSGAVHDVLEPTRQPAGAATGRHRAPGGCCAVDIRSDGGQGIRRRGFRQRGANEFCSTWPPIQQACWRPTQSRLFCFGRLRGGRTQRIGGDGRGDWRGRCCRCEGRSVRSGGRAWSASGAARDTRRRRRHAGAAHDIVRRAVARRVTSERSGRGVHCCWCRHSARVQHAATQQSRSRCGWRRRTQRRRIPPHLDGLRRIRCARCGLQPPRRRHAEREPASRCVGRWPRRSG
jgi:hypothetical protein